MTLLPVLPNVLTPVENLLETGLVTIQSLTQLPWAWCIILLTAVVRIIILPIDVKQKRSMLSMQRLQPYVKQLQQRYKDDRQALNVAMMEFYRDNRVNPLASCFPILLQAPVFIALFFVLKDFRPPTGTSTDFSFLGSFVDNIRIDISDGGWAGLVLILFYVGSQMLASKVMNTSPDPRQRMLFMLLPVAFVPLIVNFPIGVMLYWITTNLWTLGLHLVVLRFTDTAKEVVLPEDSKGRRKVVVPKSSRSTGGAGGKNAGRGKASPNAASNKPRNTPPAGARRNKRRR